MCFGWGRFGEVHPRSGWRKKKKMRVAEPVDLTRKIRPLPSPRRHPILGKYCGQGGNR